MPQRFSARTAWDTTESPLSRALREARADGREIVDLTVSNPTMCGFHYDASTLLPPLGDPASLLYDPDPRGARHARQAVAEYYQGHAATVDPDQVVLTTSTSEAYSFLFRLLCDPGDEVLVAQPSYPLFDFLADLDDVRLQPFPLFYDFGWWIDFAELERRITPRTRALLLVHPNNPTGHATSPAERLRLEEICLRHGLALVVDEVFLDYTLGEPIPGFAHGPHPCLTFVVSGLSKIAALPQMKIGWLVALGCEADKSAALSRLEVISDTFLSLNSPAQHALPAWLGNRQDMQQQILARVRANLAALQTLASDSVQVLPVQAGWAAVLRLNGLNAEKFAAEKLLAEAGVLVHPGSYYGFAGERFLVLSLLLPQFVFQEGLEKLNNWLNHKR